MGLETVEMGKSTAQGSMGKGAKAYTAQALGFSLDRRLLSEDRRAPGLSLEWKKGVLLFARELG